MINTELMEVFLGIIFLVQMLNTSRSVDVREIAFTRRRFFRLLCRSAKLHFILNIPRIIRKK